MTAPANPASSPADPRPVVLVGTGVIAQVMHEYLTREGGRPVPAFAVEKAFLREPTLLGKPVVPFEDVQKLYPPSTVDLFIAVGASQGHRLKRRLYETAKGLGYHMTTHVSPRAVVAPTAHIGDNAFVFEHAIVQPFARVGVGALLWPGCIVGHHGIVGDFCMLSGFAVVGGVSSLGDHGYMGLHSAIVDEVHVPEDCLVGAGSIVTRDASPGQVLVGNPARPKDYSFHEYFERKKA